MELTINYLYSEIGFLSFYFPDGSVRVHRTTLNKDVLRSVEPFRNGRDFYDLDKSKWVRIPSNPNVKFKITREKPDIGEVNEFANRFI